MNVLLLDCHKDRRRDSEKIDSALRRGGAQSVELFEVRKLQWPETLTDYDATVISGADGYHSRHFWIRKLKEIINEFQEFDRPILGVCYGNQLLGEMYGHQLIDLDEPEVGWVPVTLTDAGTSDPLFSGFPNAYPVFQHHKRAIRESEKLNVLARSASCVQAIRYAPIIYGVQFHAEESPESGTAFLETDPKCTDFVKSTSLRPEEYLEWRVFKNFVGLAGD